MARTLRDLMKKRKYEEFVKKAPCEVYGIDKIPPVVYLCSKEPNYSEERAFLVFFFFF